MRNNMGGKIISPINRRNLRLQVEINKNNGFFHWKCILDDEDKCWGEYIDFYGNSGKIEFMGFNVSDLQVGIWIRYNEDGSVYDKYFYSFLNPGKEIDEVQYKKELAMIRLGIIIVPALDIKISDYEK